MSSANESLPVPLTPNEPRPAADAWMPATLRDDLGLPAATASRDWPRLSGYQIVRELGRGGMGVVYLANETDFAWRRGDVSAARRDLHAALALEPAGSRAADDHVRLGQLLQRERKVEAAARAYDEALRLRPDHAAALRLRAVAMLELCRYPEAVRSLDGYLGRASVGGGAAVAEAYRLRGLTRTQLGDRDGALHDYTRSLGIQPDAATRGYRGWVYLAEGAPKLALADFEAALRLGARDGDAHAGRGNARVKLGRPEEAVRDAEEALRRGPRTARMLHNTATIFARAADRDGDARAQRQRFQQRALDLLGEALTAFPAARRPHFWTEQILKDPDLTSLHGLPRFQQLAPPR